MNKFEQLREACRTGDENVVQELLVTEKVDPNCSSEPFINACKFGHRRIIEIFLDNEVNINMTDSLGKTGLHSACDNGSLDCARLLVERGANVDLARSDNKWTPLHASIFQDDSINFVKLLLENNANPNALNNYNETALHLASWQASAPLVSLLLEHEADPAIKNLDGLTAWDVAVTRCNEKKLPMLEPSNSDQPITQRKRSASADFSVNINECVICLEKKTEKTAIIDCGHMFCQNCIQMYKLNNNTCPTCRKPIKGLLRVYE